MPTSTLQAAKLWLVDVSGLAKDALHIHVGLLVFFAVALALKKPLRSPLPWLAVLAAALLGEALDRRDDRAGGGLWRWQASVHDIINTLFWPTLILLLARLGHVFSAAPDEKENR